MNINDGTQGALNILRDTVLASMPDDDWSDVLKSVSDAGGINDRLVPYQRLMLAKAVSAYNDGVAKGDFVGHPFRGNQWGNASGGGRSMASGAGGGGRLGQRPDDKEYRGEQAGQRKKDDQDKIKGNANAFAEAEMMVIGRIKDSFVDIEDSITNDRNGISNLVDASKSAIKQAEAKAEQSDAYGDNDSGDRDAATFVRRAEERVMQHAMDTSGLLTKVQDAVTKLRETMNDGSSINTTQTMVSAVMSQFKPLLQSQRSQLRDAGDFERIAVKQGFGSSGAVTRFAMLQRSVTNTMEQLNDISDASEGAGSDAEELSREILDSQ